MLHTTNQFSNFYKSLYQLYNLKSTLEAEGLDNYVIDYHRIEIVKIVDYFARKLVYIMSYLLN